MLLEGRQFRRVRNCLNRETLNNRNRRAKRRKGMWLWFVTKGPKPEDNKIRLQINCKQRSGNFIDTLSSVLWKEEL